MLIKKQRFVLEVWILAEINMNLINEVFESLDKGNITLEKCKLDILTEINRIEEFWNDKVMDLVDQVQNGE